MRHLGIWEPLLYAPDVHVEITIDDRMTIHHQSFRLLFQLLFWLQLFSVSPALAGEQTFTSKLRMISGEDRSSSSWTKGSSANLGSPDDQLEMEVIDNDYSSDNGFDVKWRSTSDEDPSQQWQRGNFANVGFTASTLELQGTIPNKTSERQFLVFSPIYLDQLHVSIVGKNKYELELGDKSQPLPNNPTRLIPGKLVIEVPPDSERYSAYARSTSNLRLQSNLVTEAELESLTRMLTAGSALLLTIILSSVLISIIASWITGSVALAMFATYQTSWIFLLAGIQYPLLAEPLWSLSTNDAVVSYGALAATLFGALAHAQILTEFAGARIPSLILRLTAAGSVVLMIAHSLGFERESLETNVLIISVVPLFIILSLFTIHNTTTSSAMWRWIKYGYLVLMLSVVLTGVSGFGVGNLFDITYIHALLTTLLLSMILVLGVRDKSARTRTALQKSQLELSRRELVEEQLVETKAMFEMLSHEIKTPLTTLSMLMHKFPNRERAGKQIEAIRTIIEQTAIAMDVPGRQPEPDYVTLLPAVMSNWNLYTNAMDAQSLDMKVEPSLQILVDQFLLDVLLRNLIKNAVKYGEPATSHRIYTKIDHTSTLLVFSNVSKIDYTETPQFFSKYWRAAESKSSRGSGLGLWIVKRICDASGFEVDARLKGRRFRLVVRIPYYRFKGTE